jgi:3,4-dihydroxyphthalate decarboxylase
MAHRHLVDDILGHISHRVDDDTLLVRCRGPQERGLRFTTEADIRVVTTEGEILDVPGNNPRRDTHGGTGGWSVPAELPIHTSVLAARPDVDVVVHAHPRAVVTLTLAGLTLEPIVGAFDIPATRLAAAGIPVHPRSVLIRRPDLAADMVASMGGADACLLHGHGLVTAGTTVAQAVLRALQIDSLARLILDVRRVGGVPRPIPDADLADLPDLGRGFNEELLWRHHVTSLAADEHRWGDSDGPPMPPATGTLPRTTGASP